MNPVALITGAASGVGKHLALTLREQGYRLMLTDIQEEALRATFPLSDNVQTHILDVRRADEWTRLLEETVHLFGRLDYLFNIAGVVLPAFLSDTTIEEIDRQIDTNLKGTIYGTYLAARLMIQQGHGHILNMASLAGVAPVPGMEAYTASKFGVRGFSLAAGIALREKGVYVTVICPDLIDTPMLDVQLKRPEESALAFAASQPLRVEQVTQAILRAMEQKPLEVILPISRGLLARIGNAFPALGPFLYRYLRWRGLQRAAHLARHR